MSDQTHLLYHPALYHEQTHQRRPDTLSLCRPCRRPSSSNLLLLLRLVLMQADFGPVDEIRSSEVWHLCSDTESYDLHLRSGRSHLRMRCLVSNFADYLHLAFKDPLENQTRNLDFAWDGRGVS